MSLYTMTQHQCSASMAAPRQYSVGHSPSSAFSSSANPDEDWTKISDLAERRRIQNRIAQRNYRKKLKRKLEELERRAGDETRCPESPARAPCKNRKQQTSHKSQKSTAANAKLGQTGRQTPPDHGEGLVLLPTYEDRARSSSPPTFQCSSYPPPDTISMAYRPGPAHSYATPAAAESHPAYMPATVPATLPPMTHFGDAITNREVYAADDALSSYMNYPFIPSIDISSPPAYGTSNPHTPPLSRSFDHSADCSEAGYEYPATPLSMPGSPGLIPQ